MISEHFKEAFVEAGGFRIRYLEGGSGQPLIYLHGEGGLALSPAHELLAQSVRVIAFELPGSDAPEDLARRLNAAVTALGIERYSLMGSSMGSTLVLMMAILRPEPVDAIVLSAPPAFGTAQGAAELKLPILALFGTADEVSPADGARLYRDGLWSCHIMLVYGAGHAIDADRPEAFASLTGDFLLRKDQFVVSKTSAVVHP